MTHSYIPRRIPKTPVSLRSVEHKYNVKAVYRRLLKWMYIEWRRNRHVLKKLKNFVSMTVFV